MAAKYQSPDSAGLGQVIICVMCAMLLRRLRDRVVFSRALCDSCDLFRLIAVEQEALRRLAMLVARGVPPMDVLDAVAREMGQILGAKQTVLARYESGGTVVTSLGAWNYVGVMPPGSRWEIEEGTVSELVFRTGAPGRVDSYQGTGKLATTLRAGGIISSVGCPITVGRRLWGVAIASSSTPEPLPADTEERMLDFTELAAAAIANAQSHADLTASRARVVAAADEARRRMERDLHDGTQQRLVTIGLEMRAIEAMLPDGLDQLKERLCQVSRSVQDAIADLQEISRGLHPGILAKGGLRPALMALARRSAVEVDLNISTGPKLSEQLKVTIYYVVSEALTNAAKHAHATAASVDLTASDALIRLTIRDDGVGGADPAHGSGLLGLTDRVEAVGGRLQILSPAGHGTMLIAEIPTQAAEDPTVNRGDR
jgi:signal transduction histidine kinase